MTKLTVYSGLVPNKKTMNKSVFSLSVHGWLAYISSIHAPQMNTVIDEIDAAVLSIGNFAQTAEDSASAAIEAKNIAVNARDEAVNAVAQLPTGIINDATIAANDTWSSQQINTKLLGKADIASVLSLAQTQAAALCF
jgi:hypothetical protein